jgi:predicted DNA-binding transcriptional regulator AlpA
MSALGQKQTCAVQKGMSALPGAERAAAYLSMSTSTFLKLVEEGTMPKGIKVLA